MSNFFAALDSDDEAPPKQEEVKELKTSSTTAPDKKPDNKAVKPVRHSGKGDRGTKKGRGGPPPTRDGKRQFDRRSGTGRGREIKKDGGGSRNWGSDKNEAKKAEHAESAEKAANNAEDANIVEEENAVVEEEPVVEQEPEPATFSLDEYLAEKAKIQADNELFAPKEEKMIDTDFSGKAVVKIVEEDYFGLGGGKKLRKKNKDKKEVETVVPSFKVAKPERSDDRDSGRRGDRRGGRGVDGKRGGRSRGEEKKSKGSAVNVMDASAFPSL